MMNIRRVLAVVAIPFVIGTFGFVASNPANAEAPARHNTQITEQPRPNKKPQIKHRQSRPQQKKRPPQINLQNTNDHQDGSDKQNHQESRQRG
ncbi:hypothetical protein [Nostoc sp. PCC 7107]|uniref:hypothetical protein n=1 Tax=Nostoc sp. PCC 7107 TaxID=317936 RepID=UPI00029EE481|nr:hypothetical protein [Nostoc sp. PCC 7107]AFY43376.1 hypothetical protein Nos7107_2778 [Nostoc sp. PCC 7107]